MKKTIISSLVNTTLSYPRELVDVPELGDGAQIYVREMSVQQLTDYQEANFDHVGKPLSDNPFQWMVSLFVASTCNESGEPLASQSHVQELMSQLPKSVLDRVLGVAMRLNKLGGDAVADEKNVSAPAQESN